MQRCGVRRYGQLIANVVGEQGCADQRRVRGSGTDVVDQDGRHGDRNRCVRNLTRGVGGGVGEGVGSAVAGCWRVGVGAVGLNDKRAVGWSSVGGNGQGASHVVAQNA